MAGANGALVLALVSWLKEEGLTVALALQLLLLANLARDGAGTHTPLLFKLLLAVVVVRLPLSNPGWQITRSPDCLACTGASWLTVFLCLAPLWRRDGWTASRSSYRPSSSKPVSSC